MRGLLAIEPLYHQIVKGNKTQTRRSGGLETINKSPDTWIIVGNVKTTPIYPIRGQESANEITFETKEYIPYGEIAGKIRETCKPRYKVGEVLFLKEPYIDYPNCIVPKYAFDCSDEYRASFQFKNKLFMPAKYGRVFVKITGIKCERLLDITDEDCISEGVESDDMVHDDITCYKLYGKLIINEEGLTVTAINSPIKSFLSLFKFANKVKDVPNIWVWAYTFEKVDNPNITI